jgi:hypothetical protein
MRELHGAEQRLPAVAEHQVHRVGPGTLDAGHEIGVQAKLQHVARLRRARELGVDHLVGPRAEAEGRSTRRRKSAKPCQGGARKAAW